MCLLLHAVDVSHPTKSWELHKEWTARCMEEFFRQGDKERELGLDISPLCDRDSTQVPQSQIGFIDYIVVPLFNTVMETVEHVVSGGSDQLAGTPWLSTLQLNRAIWTEKAESCDFLLEPSSASEDVLPPRVFRRRDQEGEEEEEVQADQEPVRVFSNL